MLSPALLARVPPAALALLILVATGCRDRSAAPSPDAGRSVSDSAAVPTPGGAPLHEARFGMAWALAPAPQAGTSTTLSYTPRMATGAPIAALDSVHEKLSHLIVVSRDLSFFDHVHADRRADGAFEMPYTFPAGGEYVLFADYTPSDANTQVFRRAVEVGGAASSARPLGPATSEASDGDLTVALGLPEGGLAAGAHLSLSFRVRDAAGRAVNDLERYLGAGGHVVVIPESTEGFLHVHPEEAMGGHGAGEPGAGEPGAHAHSDGGHAASAETAYGPTVRFMTTFPAAGRYTLWLQVQRAGRLHTFPFVLDVAG